MADLTVAAADVAPVEVRKQITAPVAAVVTAGQVCRMTTAGKWTPANATDAANAGNARGIALESVDPAGSKALTCLQKGIIDLGDALDGEDIGTNVYLSDTEHGVLADAAGTVSVVVGKIVGNFGSTTVQKLLDVDL